MGLPPVGGDAAGAAGRPVPEDALVRAAARCGTPDAPARTLLLYSFRSATAACVVSACSHRLTEASCAQSHSERTLYAGQFHLALLLSVAGFVMHCCCQRSASHCMRCIMRRIMYVMQFLQFSLASFYDPVRSYQSPAIWYAVLNAALTCAVLLASKPS